MELKLAEDSSSKMSTPPWQTKETDSTKDPKVEHCGIGLWRPSCLEPLRDIRAFIAAMCFVSCLQASYSGYTSSQITTIEKRFAIGSIVVGTINSFFEVGYISCVMIVSYLGAKGRVPLWIGCGLFAMSCGAFLFSTPQFLFPYDPSLSTSGREHLCSQNLESQNFSSKAYCDTKEFGSYHFLPILLFAQFLIGAGSSPILTLAPPFVDDHVPASKAPAMIASLYASAALGPVFGYALGALMLQHPMDKWSKVKVIGSHPTPASEDWIGLWWAGYIILGLGVLIGAYILIMFPRTLRSTFTPRKRSLESAVIIPGTSTSPVALEDSKMISAAVDGSQGMVDQQTLPSSSSYRNRAAYQGHQRSFSGNVPFTSVSAYGGTPVPNSNTNFFPPSRPHHQRSASVSSILLHAAIIAATASHAAEEDEALPSTDTCSESSSDDEYFSASPHETEKLNKRRSRIDQTTGTNESKSSHSPIYRSKSLTARQQHQHHRRWASSFWSSSRSSSRGVPGSHLSRRSQNTAEALGIPPPILDVMLEDTTAEASTISNVPKLKNENSQQADKPDDENTSNRAKSPSVDDRRLPLRGDTGASVDQTQHHQLQLDEPLASGSKPSLFVHLHKRRRPRQRKIIRGRIFGFLADWSKDIPKSIFNLLKNKIYVVTCLCICCEMFIIIGFAGFLPKYMEIEYQISKATASMIAGGLIVPSGAIGILAGGLILNKAKLNLKGAVLFVFGINFVIVGCMSSFFFLGCENPKIAGFTVPYPTGLLGNQKEGGLNTSMILKPWEVRCSRSCGCNPNLWKPVCHPKTNTIFFSPCYAGCTQGPTFIPSTNQYVYHQCQCLWNYTSDPQKLSFLSQRNGATAASITLRGDPMNTMIYDDEVFSGVCAPGCKMLVPFVSFLTALLFLTGVIQNPLLMVTMRSVRHSQRSLALGLQFVIIRLLANLPSPIAFGRAIDGACLLWKDECGRRGDCAFMDLKQLTQYITGLGIVVKGSSLIVYIVLIYLLSRRQSGPTMDSNADEELAITVKLHEDDALRERKRSQDKNEGRQHKL